MRSIPKGSLETADALVFYTDSNRIAKLCRDSLIEAGLGTKILPEAITWHFAGTWTHMPELTLKKNDKSLSFPKSLALLNKAVALPISVKMNKEIPDKIYQALAEIR